MCIVQTDSETLPELSSEPISRMMRLSVVILVLLGKYNVIAETPAGFLTYFWPPLTLM